MGHSRRRWLAVFEAPQLRAYAELCNDPRGFEVRKDVIKAHEKTRRWDERVGAGTGSLGRGEGMRCSLAPSKLDFEPLQRRRSFLIDPVASRANGQSLELQFVENIPTVCASARAPFPSAAGTRRRRRNRTADRCSVPVRPVPGAICRVRRPVSTPLARAHAAPLRSRNRRVTRWRHWNSPADSVVTGVRPAPEPIDRVRRPVLGRNPVHGRHEAPRHAVAGAAALTATNHTSCLWQPEPEPVAAAPRAWSPTARCCSMRPAPRSAPSASAPFPRETTRNAQVPGVGLPRLRGPQEIPLRARDAAPARAARGERLERAGGVRGNEGCSTRRARAPPRARPNRRDSERRI